MDSFVLQLDVKYKVRLEQEGLQKLHAISPGKGLNKLSGHLGRGVSEVYSQGILDRLKKDIPESQIVVRTDEGVEEAIGLETVLEIRQAAAQYL